MVEDYIQRKHGKRKVKYVLPQVQPILEETYGVIVYQEQVMQIAVEVAGFSMGQADLLRKAMGKKKPEVMAKQKQLFIDGAAERGVAAARRASCGSTSSPSPATASTRATASPTPCWPTRRPTSRRTTRWSSWPRC